MIINIIVFCILNLALVYFSLSLSFLLKINRGLIVLASTTILYFSTIIFTLTILGVLRLLNAQNYFIAILSLVIIFFLFIGRKQINEIKQFIIYLWLRVAKLKKYQIAGLAITIVALTYWAARLLAVPVWDYDAIAYHLPFTAKFIQNSSIREIYFAAVSGPIGYYPANIELLYTHFLMFFHIDSILNALNLIYYVLILVVWHLIGKELKISKSISILAGLAFLSTPVVIKLLGTTKIDLFVMLFFGLLVLFLIKYIKWGNWPDLIFIALSAGMLLGARFLALPYLVLPFLALLIILIKKIKSGEAVRTIFLYFFALLLFTLIGGYWYLRNYLVTGNPIFPAQVAIFGHTIFEGLRGGFATVLSGTSIASNFDVPSILDQIIKPYLIGTGIIFPLAIFTFLLLLIFKIKQIIADKLTLFILLATPLYFALYIVLPFTFRDFNQNIRYSLPALFLTLLLVGIGSFLFSSKFVKIGTGIILSIVIVTNLYLTVSYKEPQAVLGADLDHIPPTQREFFTKLAQSYGGFAPILEVMYWADQNLPENAKIGYSGFQFNYGLYGKRLTRSVDFIAPGTCHDCNHYDFNDFEGNIFANADFNAWLSNIRYYQLDYYVFYNQGPFPESEKAWLSGNPKLFRLIHTVDGAYIYAILSNLLAS